ncbi:MAG: hypothetical protein LUO95_12630 [Methylococcaceae bacterium]|nr:hypothetical protein [Methylococcaceae bacterium]MDD1611392.1 hypothetical protein [Methylococcaceae bacterium]
MKKLTSISLIIMLMIFLGITSVAQARTGSTSDSSHSSTSKSRTTTSSSSSSKPKKNTSTTDSIFSNIAKTNQAKKAWQERNKKVEPPVVANVPAPVQDNNANRRQEQQLDAIQKQIADAKRQQQIIAAAQTAAQIAINNNNKRPAVTPMPPVSNLPNTPINTTDTQPEPANSGGTSWFTIFLVVGGIVFVIFWLKKRNSSNTIYRL